MKPIDLTIDFTQPIPERPELGVLYLRVPDYDGEEICTEIREGLLAVLDGRGKILGFDIEFFPRDYEDVMQSLRGHPLRERFNVPEAHLFNVTLESVLEWAYQRFAQGENPTKS